MGEYCSRIKLKIMEVPLVSHFISRNRKEMNVMCKVLYVASKEDSKKELLRREVAWILCLTELGGGDIDFTW